ncbi:MAG: phosphatase PAP2 family protein [Mangrovibacterium sp.]
MKRVRVYNAQRHIAYGISILFHPLIIPTLAFLLLMNSGFYFALLPFRAKQTILLVVFLSTFLLPLTSLALLRLNPLKKTDLSKSQDRIIPLLVSTLFYYLGYILLGKLEVYPVYRLFLISSILIVLLMMIISIRWKISIHMAAIGGLTGAVIALSLRLQLNSSLLLTGLVGIAGLLGTARLVLKRHNPLQVYAGFFIGFSVNYLIINYI